MKYRTSCLGERERTRLQEICDPNSVLWLFPHHYGIAIAAGAWRHAVCMRLGTNDVTIRGDDLKCPFQTLETAPCKKQWSYDHHQACRHVSRTIRHDNVKWTISRYLRQLGITVAVEPRSGPTNERADLEIYVGGQRYLLDVTVVHTGTPVKQPTQIGAWAEQAAAHKTEEYKLMMKFETDAVFVPLAFESWGVFDKEVDTFLEKVVSSQDFTSREWEVDHFDEMRVAIAVAIQEGNYTMAVRTRPLGKRMGKGPPVSG